MDWIRVIVNRALAIRENIDERRALALGVAGALIGPPAVGYAVTIAMARREAPPPRPSDEVERVLVPEVTGKTVKDAVAELAKAGLTSALTPVGAKDSWTVTLQNPVHGTKAPTGSTVVLTAAQPGPS